MEEKIPAAAPQENKMGVLPVGPLLFNMAVPMMMPVRSGSISSPLCLIASSAAM